MKYLQTELEGCFVVEPNLLQDERGAFARTMDAEELATAGLASTWVQCSTSYNRRRGTLRGMHLQAEPHGETKLVRCVRGAIFDVAVDLRPGSPTFHRWAGAELTQDNRLALYVPKGCAHGFLTLTDDAEVLYMMDAPYVGDAAGGVRWDDPAFGIAWPAQPVHLAERDATYPSV